MLTERLPRLSDLAFRSPETAPFWIRFQVVAPHQAERVARIELLDTDEAVRRMGDTDFAAEVPYLAGPDGSWMWVNDTLELGEFVEVILRVGYGCDNVLTRPLIRYFVNDSSDDAMQFGHRVAEAAATWTISDVEERLGLTIGQAYANVGFIPVWADLRTWPVSGSDLPVPATHPAFEPHDFLLGCLDGLYHGDTFWLHYAWQLFGSLPQGALR